MTPVKEKQFYFKRSVISGEVGSETVLVHVISRSLWLPARASDASVATTLTPRSLAHGEGLSILPEAGEEKQGRKRS